MEERLLVVDDEKDICDILKFNLENEGYIVDVANSGEEALKILSNVHNLIILDVMMNGISGFKMAEILREESMETLVLDHPSEPGCFIYRKHSR
jgi:DNA-binding response OmpR family regulator